jgi:tRNA threonylcarbamoyl adenosine modification protein (Sua5/YciO/YrdC/YwlC family)
MWWFSSRAKAATISAFSKAEKARGTALLIQIHPDNPQARLIKQIADIIRQGGVVVYPTDSAYAIGCHLGDKQAVDRIRKIRQINDKHHLTLMCQNLSELGTYARVTDNSVFRLLKAHTPGPYVFLLKATKDVPKRLMHAKRKTIGLRIPDNNIVQAMLAELGEPMMSTSLILPGQEDPETDPYEIQQLLGTQVDAVVDGGFCGFEPTSVIDFFDDLPRVVRAGKGSVVDFE